MGGDADQTHREKYDRYRLRNRNAAHNAVDDRDIETEGILWIDAARIPNVLDSAVGIWGEREARYKKVRLVDNDDASRRVVTLTNAFRIEISCHRRAELCRTSGDLGALEGATVRRRQTLRDERVVRKCRNGGDDARD